MGAPTRGSADRISRVIHCGEGGAKPFAGGQQGGPEAGAVPFNAANWRSTVVDGKCL
jgi:hypothetical protein